MIERERDLEGEGERVPLLTMALSVYLSAKMMKATRDLHMCTPGRQEISHHCCSPAACLNVMWYMLQLQREGKREARGAGGG